MEVSEEAADDRGELGSGLAVEVPVGTSLVTTAPLNLRKGPGTMHAVLRVVPGGDRVTVLQAKPSSSFYNVRYGSFSGWCHGNYLRQASAPSPSPSGGGKCLVGVHGRADGPLEAADLAAIRVARAEAVKLTSSAQSVNVDWLRQINPRMFIMVRMFADISARVATSAEFARWMEGDLAPFYAKGIRYFEVHNEPNLTVESWGRSWKNGREFAAWYLDVVRRLRVSFPDARFGYPGLSPGESIQGVRTDAWKFLAESDEAVRAADFVSAHSYWLDEASMDAVGAGRSYEEIRRRYPGKTLFITEFSNPGGQDVRRKSAQYVRYYQSLRNQPGIGAAFSFVVSASGGFQNEVWRLEDGRLTDIPYAVGNRTF